MHCQNPYLKGVLGCGRSVNFGDGGVLDGTEDDGAGISACRTICLAQLGRRGSLLVSEDGDGESLAILRSMTARRASWSSFC